jgi:hypothetical protein
MQGIQWTNSTLAQICIQELATNFYQGQFPCWACCRAFYCACCRASIAVNLLAYMCRVSWLNATTRVFIIQLPHAIHLTYYHVFYVKPSMSQTPKLMLYVFESTSSVLNIQPRVTIVWWYKFAQRLIYSYFLLTWVNLVLFLIATVIACISLG